MSSLPTLEGHALDVFVDGSGTVAFLPPGTCYTVRVVASNKFAHNGVAHELNKVMLPPLENFEEMRDC